MRLCKIYWKESASGLERIQCHELLRYHGVRSVMPVSGVWILLYPGEDLE